MATRIQLSEEQRNALLDQDNLPDKLVVKRQEYTPHETIKAGCKGAIWKITDEYGRFRAAKLAIYEDYEERSFLEELSYAAKLEPYPEFAKFTAADLFELDLPKLGNQRFVCFIEEWIDGITLKDFLEKNTSDVSCSFLKAYVDDMCSALKALRELNLRHDDLHSENVMLARPAQGMLDQNWRVKIIDTGSLKPLDIPTRKPKDDHRHFVAHLVAIHNTIKSKKLLALREKRFLDDCFKFLNSMLDDDPSVALRTAEEIKSQFNFAYSRSNFPRSEQTPTLQSPFEYISAEHIADDRLLVKIFADSCPWLEKVAGPDPCLVTGPRGCGKSTIFRWLSLKTHLNKENLDPKHFRVIGFYISCSSDLQNRLSWIKTEALAQKFRREIIHYFNLFLAREIVQTLCIINNREDKELKWGLGKIQEKVIHQFIESSLQISHPTFHGVSLLQHCLELLEKEMFRCHVQILKGLNLGWTTPETFIGDFTTLLSKNIGFLRNRPIAFLVDDFSIHRLPSVVQIILNRIIWERRGTHIFKLSSEKYGAVLTDSFDATVDVTREMLEIDCGREYIALDDTKQLKKAQRFATELLANRLEAADYEGTPEKLLGHSDWSEGSLGRALRDKPEGRINTQYNGIECIANLCSGDVSTLLLVYRRIFEKGGVDKTFADLVPKHIQHDAIESVSRELFEAIKHHYPHGATMYSIVREFGTLVRRILEQGRMIKGKIPPQCPRIEVDQDFNSTEEFLTGDQEHLARELVRRALFIEMEPGRSRHKLVTTLRWQLRRVYLPAFGAALSKNDAVKWRPTEFKFFLTNPHNACEMEWQKKQKEPKKPKQVNKHQESLNLK